MGGYYLTIEEGGAEAFPKVANQILTFIYSIAHQIGVGIIKIITLILPEVKIPSELVDPIGFLAFLTIFLLLFKVAQKVAWIIVIAGWVLIIIRILIAIF